MDSEQTIGSRNGLLVIVNEIMTLFAVLGFFPCALKFTMTVMLFNFNHDRFIEMHS